MSEAALEEYVKVTRAIENIQNKINRYKETVVDTIKRSSSDKEQKEKAEEFRQMMQKIKTDPTITKKYRTLKQRQEELKRQLITVAESEIDKKISDLKVKYSALSRRRIVIVDDDKMKYIELENARSAETVKFNTIIDEIQSNLIKDEMIKKAEQ